MINHSNHRSIHRTDRSGFKVRPFIAGVLAACIAAAGSAVAAEPIIKHYERDDLDKWCVVEVPTYDGSGTQLARLSLGVAELGSEDPLHALYVKDVFWSDVFVERADNEDGFVPLWDHSTPYASMDYWNAVEAGLDFSDSYLYTSPYYYDEYYFVAHPLAIKDVIPENRFNMLRVGEDGILKIAGAEGIREDYRPIFVVNGELLFIDETESRRVKGYGPVTVGEARLADYEGAANEIDGLLYIDGYDIELAQVNLHYGRFEVASNAVVYIDGTKSSQLRIGEKKQDVHAAAKRPVEFVNDGRVYARYFHAYHNFENNGLIATTRFRMHDKNDWSHEGIGDIHVKPGTGFAIVADERFAGGEGLEDFDVEGLYLERSGLVTTGYNLLVGGDASEGSTLPVDSGTLRLADGSLLTLASGAFADGAALTHQEGVGHFLPMPGSTVVIEDLYLTEEDLLNRIQSKEVVLARNFTVLEHQLDKGDGVAAWAEGVTFVVDEDNFGHQYRAGPVADTDDGFRVRIERIPLSETFPDVLLPGLTNPDPDGGGDLTPAEWLAGRTPGEHPDVEYVRDVVADKTLGGVREKAAVLDNTALTAASGGIGRATHRAVESAGDALAGRLLRREGRSDALWVDVVASHARGDASAFDLVRGNAGFRDNRYGVVAGIDRAFDEAGDVVAGIAFLHVRDSIESRGFLDAENDAVNTGAFLYGDWRAAGGLRFSALAGVVKTKDEVENRLPVPARRATVDAKTTAWTASLGVERDFAVGAATVTPHAGVGVVHLRTKDFDTVVGKARFPTSLENRTVVDVPMGVRVSGGFERDGWFVEPSADVTCRVRSGGRGARYTLTASSGDVRRHEAAWLGGSSVKASLALRATHRSGFSTGLAFGAAKSANGFEGRVRAELRYAF